MTIGVLIPLAPFGLILGLFYIYRFFRKMRKTRNPFKEKLLRSPGESTLKEVDRLSEEILVNVLNFVMIPLVVYSIHVTQVHYLGVNDSAWSRTITIVIVTVLMIYFGYSLIKSLNLRWQYRLGFDGEIYVGQELNQLMFQGYRVFHDFPAECFNIDHVLVGSSGIYAVETKARRKPKTGHPSHDAQVCYDGHVLSFPKGKERQPIEQAIRQAKWLENWLSNVTGESISVKPLLALPGWFVKKTSPTSIWVGNPKMLHYYFQNQSKNILNEKQIKSICHQLNDPYFQERPARVG